MLAEKGHPPTTPHSPLFLGRHLRPRRRGRLCACAHLPTQREREGLPPSPGKRPRPPHMAQATARVAPEPGAAGAPPPAAPPSSFAPSFPAPPPPPPTLDLLAAATQALSAGPPIGEAAGTAAAPPPAPVKKVRRGRGTQRRQRGERRGTRAPFSSAFNLPLSLCQPPPAPYAHVHTYTLNTSHHLAPLHHLSPSPSAPPSASPWSRPRPRRARRPACRERRRRLCASPPSARGRRPCSCRRSRAPPGRAPP